MSLYTALYGVYHRLNLRRKGSRAWALAGELARAEREPPERLRARRERALARVAEAALRAPATAPRLREAGLDPRRPSLDALARLRPIDRADLQRDADRMVPEGTDRARLRVNATGGSTGEPVRFYQGPGYWDHAHAAELAVLAWWGVRIGDRTAAVWGADREFTELSAKERSALRFRRYRLLNAFDLDPARLDRFVDMLSRWRPAYVLGYAGALDLLAARVLERGVTAIRPRAVRSSAEVLSEAARERIARAFSAPVYDFYGCREVNNLAAECPAHRGLHVLEATRVVEVVDAAGRPLPAGAEGRVVVTDLVNTAMPLVRYATGDLAVAAEGPCPCGRTYARLERITGRTSDFVVTPDGRRLHGEVFSHLFYELPGVRRFQLRQELPAAVELILEADPAGPAPDLGRVREGLERILGPGVAAGIRVVDTLPPSPSGKRRFVVSRAGAAS